MDFNQVRQFNFPTIIRFGAGAVKELAPYLKNQGFLKPLIVTDPVIAELPFFKNICADLTQAGFRSKYFALSIKIRSSRMCMPERLFGMPLIAIV
jgi:alcohol dehydrogenase class IV